MAQVKNINNFVFEHFNNGMAMYNVKILATWSLHIFMKINIQLIIKNMKLSKRVNSYTKAFTAISSLFPKKQLL